ncbi:hypothetical protein sce1087 [Sorangium cellulosum So ce56]|uniref:Secreted protein n=1 Tax=Sorangium cellulosum (strain So ce56) TaxID=448385 RepID=A9F077_SORC5|nr:hypothetical protein [Sorangium cellulosum]CAN91244.1 hypothetical protein sce1087 [Sorangium cellulosum So ce56]
MRTLRFYGTFSLAAQLALAALAGCGERFTAAGASATSTSSSGGEGGGGGAGGDGGGGSGGAGGQASSSAASGGGGEGGCGACKEGEFCTASETCVSCAARGGVLSFGALSEIEVVGAVPAFPRVRAEPGEGEATLRLVYTAKFGSDDTKIATATGRPWTAGEVVSNFLVDDAGGQESGPLLLPLDAPSPRAGFPAGSLLFDRLLTAPGSLPQLFVADGLEATQADALPALNPDGGSRSVAVAHGQRPSYRYWFMNRPQDAGGTTSRLVTKRAEDAEVQVLDIHLPGDCPARGDDLAPWVTPDGRLLFFQAPYSARGECETASVLRSFYVALGDDGLPVDDQPARMLLPNLNPSVAIMTPSLSPDECTLYLASDKDGQQKLFAASRR